MSHNAPFCNGNVHTCAHFCYKIMHWDLPDALRDLWGGSICALHGTFVIWLDCRQTKGYRGFFNQRGVINASQLDDVFQCAVWRPMASLTKEVKSRWAKHPLVFNGRLANRRLTSSVKEATGNTTPQSGHSWVLRVSYVAVWNECFVYLGDLTRRSGACHTNWISIEFEIWPNVGVFWFSICATDHNEIFAHVTTVLLSYRTVCKISFWSAEYIRSKSMAQFHWISNLIEKSLVGPAPDPAVAPGDIPH